MTGRASRIASLSKRMKWFHTNRYDIGRADIRDELIAIDKEVTIIEREGKGMRVVTCPGAMSF